MKRFLVAALLSTLCWSMEAGAGIKILKHDQFSEDISVAVSQINGKSLAVQPAFAQGEAFGQVFKLSPGEFPVKIRGIQLVMAAPPASPNLKTHMAIEFYYDPSDGPTPSKAEPDWAIDTTDLYDPNTGATGVPVQGGVGIQIDFDWETAENHPPVMTSGNLWLVMRYIMPSTDMFDEWGIMECVKIEGMTCGCQSAGLLLDEATTSGVNLINYFTSGCGGQTSWNWLDKLGVTGDPILRVKVETSNTCVPDCSGKNCGDDGCGGSCGICAGEQECVGGVCAGPCQPDCTGRECGDDGCGGSCGDCDDGTTCLAGQCVASADSVVVSGISPDFGYNDVETPVSIVGSGFKPGLTAKVGGIALGSVQVSGDALIQAVVPAGMEPGQYMVVVVNSDQTTGFLADAFQVRAREVAPPDEVSRDTGPACGDGCSEDIPGVGGGSCSAGVPAPSNPFAALALLLALLASIAAARQRRAS